MRLVAACKPRLRLQYWPGIVDTAPDVHLIMVVSCRTKFSTVSKGASHGEACSSWMVWTPWGE